MYNVSSKNLIPLCILKILEEHSDEQNHLTQEKILHYLDYEYNITIERKAVGRTIEHMKHQLNLDIASDKKGSWLQNRIFDDSELRFLIDVVLSSRFIKQNYSRALINKLCMLSGKSFYSKIENLATMTCYDSKTENAEFFYNISLIDEAIEKKQKISFQYWEYDTDKKLHMCSSHNLSPYYLFFRNGHYYVIGSLDNHELKRFKLDNLKNTHLLKDKSLSFRYINSNIKEKNFLKQILSDPVISFETPIKCTFYANKSLVNEIVEYFGKQIVISEVANIPKEIAGLKYPILVVVNASPMAIKNFTLKYLDSVRLISPVKLKEEIKDILMIANINYDISINSSFKERTAI